MEKVFKAFDSRGKPINFKNNLYTSVPGGVFKFTCRGAGKVTIDSGLNG